MIAKASSETEKLIIFPATLGVRERLVTYLVGYGVGMGLPVVMSLVFAFAFSEPWPLLLPIPFLLGFGSAYLFRPLAFGLSGEAIFVLRPMGSIKFPLRHLTSVRLRPDPAGVKAIGLARVQGFNGAFGMFWNRRWGRFRVYITNSANVVTLNFEDRGRVLVSPDDPQGFVNAVSQARRLATASQDFYEE